MLYSALALGREAVITADDITSNTIKGAKDTDIAVSMTGNVEIQGEDFKVTTQKATMYKNSKDIYIPVKSKMEYTGANETLTVYSNNMSSNPANKTYNGDDVSFISNVASYKAKHIDVANGNAMFKSVKFSLLDEFKS